MLKKISLMAVMIFSLNGHNCYARTHHHSHHNHSHVKHVTHHHLSPALSRQVKLMRKCLIQTRQSVNKYCNSGICTNKKIMIEDYKKSEDQFQCYTDAFDNHHRFEYGYKLISKLESEEFISKAQPKAYSAYQRLLDDTPAYLSHCRNTG